MIDIKSSKRNVRDGTRDIFTIRNKITAAVKKLFTNNIKLSKVIINMAEMKLYSF